MSESPVKRIGLAWLYFFFFQAEDGIRDVAVTGVQTCALPISRAVQRCGGLCVRPGAEQQQQHAVRSEEHTSELQSRLHLVCRLLLEKKKTRTGPLSTT